jgi:hypothetical protein
MRQAQQMGGAGGTQSTLEQGSEYNRNDIVTVTKDGKEQTLKFKKAQELLAQGWEIKK